MKIPAPALLVLASALTLSLLPHESYAPAYESAQKVWRVDTDDSFGTAFPVACKQVDCGKWEVLFLTAHHVIAESSEIDLWLRDRRLADVRVLAYSEDLDVALLRAVTRTPVQFLEFETSTAFADWVLAVGYPMGRPLIMSAGLLAHDGWSDTDIYYGNSGGPLLNAHGRVVGVVCRVLINRHHPHTEAAQHAANSTLTPTLETWLDDHGIDVHKRH